MFGVNVERTVHILFLDYMVYDFSVLGYYMRYARDPSVLPGSSNGICDPSVHQPKISVSVYFKLYNSFVINFGNKNLLLAKPKKEKNYQ